MSFNATYRADIDGLRAVSVILVLLFHLGVGPFAGGFIGVDVFFVISGYLISGIIFDALDHGRFSFAWFYARRARRILPALLAVIITTLGAGYFLVYPGDYVTLARSAGYAIAALSNFFFLYNTGYFDLAAQHMPLLHTWSLGVEEQFYLVWPATLLIGYKLFGNSSKAWRWLLAILIIVSFAAANIELTRDPKAAFYLPHTRAWELALGGLMLFMPIVRGQIVQVLPVIGLAGICYAALTVTAESPFPGLNAIAPTLGAALIIYPASRDSWANALLGSRPLAFLGCISYSLYLWHWPIIAFWREYLDGAALSNGDKVVIAGLSVVLAAVSWKFIEQPFRQTRARPARVLSTAAVAMAGSAILVVGIVLFAGLPNCLPATAAALVDRVAMWKWEGCRLRPPTGSSPTAMCIFGDDWDSARQHAVLWGDSIAESMAPILETIGKRDSISFVLATNCSAIFHRGGLRRYIPAQPHYDQDCLNLKIAVKDLLSREPAIDFMVLISAWSTLAQWIDDDGQRAPHDRALPLMRKGFDELLSELVAPGRRIIISAEPPATFNDPVRCALAGQGLLRRPCVHDPKIIPRSETTWQEPVNALLQEVARTNPGVVSYDPGDSLCNAESCIAYVNGEFIYRDGGHIRRDLRPETRSALADLLGLSRLFQSAGRPSAE